MEETRPPHGFVIFYNDAIANDLSSFKVIPKCLIIQHPDCQNIRLAKITGISSLSRNYETLSELV